MQKVNIALVGIGNCAKSFVESLYYLSNNFINSNEGIIGRDLIGGLSRKDLSIVAAFDIDARKVGKYLNEAIRSSPNCAYTIGSREVGEIPLKVKRAPTLDGLPEHLRELVIESKVREPKKREIIEYLRKLHVEVIVIFLPTGSDRAVKYWSNICINTKASMVNGTPTFLSNDVSIMNKFLKAKCSYIGDDMKSQLGATNVNYALLSLLDKQGITIKSTSQINIGGNTDFLNLINRGSSKVKSKSESLRNISDSEEFPIHIDFSYDKTRKDNKRAIINIEAINKYNVPFSINLILDVEDSPNTIDIMYDAVRCVAAANRKKLYGYLKIPSARLMKFSRVKISEAKLHLEYENFIKWCST